MKKIGILKMKMQEAMKMAMKGIFFNIFAAVALLLGTSLFTTACSGNDDDAINVVPEGTAEYVKVPYSVTVNSGSVTRATADGNTLYFSEGDILHVESAYIINDMNIKYCYGNLTMTSGAGSQSATFEGDLYVPVNFNLSYFKDVDYILLGENDKMGAWYDENMMYLDNRYEPYITKEMSEAVEKYSNIGYRTSGGFTDDVIQLAQRNAFMSFRLDLPFDKIIIDNIKAVDVSFEISDGYSITVSTPRDFSASVDPSKYLEFVVPFDVEAYIPEGKRITNIEVELNRGNGGPLIFNVPCGNEGKALLGGHVYNVKMKVPAPNNISNPLVGDIVKFGDIEGMVVELKGGRKVAIALYNVGGSQDTDFGTIMTYNTAKDNYLTDGWYIPTPDEFEAFANQNDDKVSIFVNENRNSFARYLIAEVPYYNRLLYIPFAIGNNNNEKSEFDDYWTSESYGNGPDGLHMKTFGYQYDNGEIVTIKPYIYDSAIKNERYVRLFHAIR